MALLTERQPPRGIPLDVGWGVRRIVAANPTPMTYHGTNTYLIPQDDGIAVLDPGPPDDEVHVDAVVAATGQSIVRILISHTHHDHLGAAGALKARTGAPICAFVQSAEPGFTPDIGLRDGDRIGGLTAVHTPGHAIDHLCYAMPGGVLFTGDHVMGWSSTVVSPPRGNLLIYIASLRKLLDRTDIAYLPGHGPVVHEPHALIKSFLDRRMMREREISKAMSAPQTLKEIADRVYSKPNETLQRAAERNLLAHLLKLEAEGKAAREGDIWSLTPGACCSQVESLGVAHAAKSNS